MIRIMLIDDHAIVREGLAGLIQKNEDLTIVASASGGAEALEICKQIAIDVILLDLKMPDMDGFEALSRLRALNANLPIVILSSDGRDETLRRALKLGATGFLPKSVRAWDLAQSIRLVARTGRLPHALDLSARFRGADTSSLTDREHDILGELARGSSNEVIAETLGVSLNTVKTHVNRILGKLEATTRTEAVVKALRNGILDID